MIEFCTEHSYGVNSTGTTDYQQVLLVLVKVVITIDASLCIIISTTPCAVYKQTIYYSWIVTRTKRIKVVVRMLATERWVRHGLSRSNHPINIWDISTGKRTCFNFPVCRRKNEAEQIVQQASVMCLSQVLLQRIEKTTREQVFLNSTRTTREDFFQNVKKEIEFLIE